MQCREVNELLSPYLDGVLNSVKMEIVSAHLAVCPGCRADFQALSEVVGVLKALSLVELPAGFTADVRMRMSQMKPHSCKRSYSSEGVFFTCHRRG